MRLRDAVPDWLLELATERRNGATPPAPPVSGVIPSGQRNHTLASLAGTMRRRGLGETEILAALTITNETRCRPPLADGEVAQVVHNISGYAPVDRLGEPAYTGATLALSETRAIFERHLYLPDPGGLYVVLATVAANLLEGDPLWLLLIAASGGGKTELLNALLGLADVHVAATLTEAALLSGTSKRETASDARGGLLRVIGEHGILVHKDFGSVLSMNRDARAAVLAALREVYDGSWTRHVGTDGGRTLSWSGKLGLVAGATPVIDQHHAVMAALGERFLLYRVDVGDTSRQAEQSLANSGNIRRVRAELRDAVNGLFSGLDLAAVAGGYDRADVDRLVALSTLIVRCRSAVIRDPYSRDVELVPDAEAPGRLVSVLGRLLTALRLIGVVDAEAWRVTLKAALDSMPALRRQTLELLLGHTDPVTTTTVAATIDLPTQTARRVLQDLTAHGVASRIPAAEKGKADTWQVTAWARQQHENATVPEKSEEA